MGGEDIETPLVNNVDDTANTPLLRKRFDSNDVNVCLTWKDVKYTIKGTAKGEDKHILKGITAMCPPGKTLAILGPSGAGKTSMLDLLAGRQKSGTTEGIIQLNGVPTSRKLMKAHSGYVLQDDVFHGHLTVQETLEFTAKLRLPYATKSERLARIQQVLDLLGLNHVKDSKVGTALSRGISGGEKKRLSIGVEMVTDPSLIFLDEPTTGLDAFNAASVMHSLATLASTGKSIIFSVHQPSSRMFNAFDFVLVLTGQGELAYFGPAEEAMQFVQKDCQVQVDQFVNPAEFLLDLVCTPPKGCIDMAESTAVFGSHVGQALHIVECYAKSQRMSHTLARIEAFSGISVPEPVVNSRTGSFFRQFAAVFHRSLLNNLRNPMKTVVMWSVSVFFAVVIGSIYWQVKGIEDRMGVLFFLAMNCTFSNLGFLELFLTDRIIFTRERASGAYSPFAYFLGTVIQELPLPLISGLLFSGIAYPMIGLNPARGRFFWHVMGQYLLTICSYSMCLFVSCFAPTFAIANTICPLIIILFLLPSGFLVNTANIPWMWGWLKHVSFFRFGFMAVVRNEFEGLEFPGPAGIIITGEDVLKLRSLDDPGFEHNLWVTAMFTLLYLTLGFLCLQFLQKEKR